MATFFKLLFQLILSPSQGWQDVSHDAVPYSRLASSGFYPLIAVAALLFFMQGLYHPGLYSFGVMVQEVIIIFVEYFLSFFLAQFIFSCFIHRYVMTEPSENHNATYIIFGLSLLALASLVENCLPIYLPVRQFFAIYIAIVLWRGVRYMAIYPHKVGHFMLMAIGAIILPPFIINFLFNIIINLPS
ncbi:MAG: hypothetical protein HFJ94_02745 [Muribaculaceae bacterium]|nr:hypothetical protein [Muribaculaceae bacterium]